MTVKLVKYLLKYCKIISQTLHEIVTQKYNYINTTSERDTRIMFSYLNLKNNWVYVIFLSFPAPGHNPTSLMSLLNSAGFSLPRVFRLAATPLTLGVKSTALTHTNILREHNPAACLLATCFEKKCQRLLAVWPISLFTFLNVTFVLVAL